ncbi:MAG: hypothetical protein IPL49_03465 [Saprospirales bacterium]|nr:hypothetical protein [Saprospirales bacterium]
MSRIFLAISFWALLGGTILTAQDTFQPKPVDDTDNKGLIYNKEVAFNMRLHTNGFAMGVDFGRLRTYYKTRTFHVELGELKHHKEYRTNLDRSSATGRISRAFIYGKQNNFFVLRGGIGEKRYFSEKAKYKGVAIGISYKGGPSIGLLKPYYLELLSTENNNSPFLSTVSVKYSEKVHDAFLDPWNIFGSSSWVKGFDEISLVPGLHGQFAVHFDWGAFDEYLKAVEAGVMVDVFFRKVPIMVEVPNVENRPFFLNLYINLLLGKRS